MRRLASDRSNCYGLFALVFRDVPAPEVVAALRAPPSAATFVDLGYDAADDLAGELQTVTDRLCEEYTHIFVGPGPHISPYGSVHQSDEGALWGDSTVRVKRFIETVGLTFQGDWDSIPDHVSVELELMQTLAAHEAQLWARFSEEPERGSQDGIEQLTQCLRAEEEFLRDHVCRWVPRFCGRASERARLPFYGEMARLAGSAVAADLEHVDAAKAALATFRAMHLARRGKPLQEDGP